MSSYKQQFSNYLRSLVDQNWAAAALLGLYAWDWVDQEEARALAHEYQPYRESEEPRYIPKMVSLVVPTINWDNDLATCVYTWIVNEPLEIIFVTTRELEPALSRYLTEAPGLREAVLHAGVEVVIVTVEKPSKRAQVVRGVNEAKGQIIALVDDDARWTTVRTLSHLLHPFEYYEIGLVGGPIGSYLPEERKDSRVITAWEVAALRQRSRRERGMRAFLVADGSTNFTVSGLTMLVRAGIVKDPYFQYLYLHDMWNDVRQNIGDDSFITRYVLFGHQLKHRQYSSIANKGRWKLGIQMVPEAEVRTSLLRNSRFAQQAMRWYRTGLRLRLTVLLHEPNYFGMLETAPYMARKMIGGMFTPIVALIRFILWCMVWRSHPALAVFLIFWVLWGWVASLASFYEDYPFVWRKIWAAMLADHLYLISDIYAWATLGSEAWTNRDKPAIDEKAAEEVFNEANKTAVQDPRDAAGMYTRVPFPNMPHPQ